MPYTKVGERAPCASVRLHPERLAVSLASPRADIESLMKGTDTEMRV